MDQQPTLLSSRFCALSGSAYIETSLKLFEDNFRTESEDCNFVRSSSWIRAVATKMTHTEKYTTVHINHLPVALAGGTSVAFDDGGLCGCGVLALATM